MLQFRPFSHTEDTESQKERKCTCFPNRQTPPLTLHFSPIVRHIRNARLPYRWTGRSGPTTWPPRSTNMWVALCVHRKFISYVDIGQKAHCCIDTDSVWDRINRAKGGHTEIYLGCQQAGVAIVVVTLHISQVATDVSNGCENTLKVATDVANDCDNTSQVATDVSNVCENTSQVATDVSNGCDNTSHLTSCNRCIKCLW